jgi:hypothetical protein
MMMEPRVPIAYGKVRKAWTLPEDLITDLEAWRAAQRPIPTESQAVAELLARAIEAWRKEQEPEPPKPRRRL